MSEPTCNAILRNATYLDQAEYCENPVEEDSEYCSIHLDPGGDDWLDELAIEEWKERSRA